MDPRLRRLLVAATVVLGFLAAFLGGVLFERTVGGERAGDGGSTTGAPDETPRPTGTGQLTIDTGGVPGATTEPPGSPITPRGEVLRVGDQRVVAAPESAPCTALVTPGRLGTCGFVDMAGGRVAWVVERRPAAGGDAFAARLFTHVASAGGWVERLAAEDADGTRWDDVRILAADVTGDGRPEVLAGFRLDGEGEALSYDIVVYPSGDVPRVAAHPGAAGMGAVLVAGGAIEEYAASYPNDEPVCCPPAFVHRTIRHVDGFFRVVATDTVVPGSVPPSQI